MQNDHNEGLVLYTAIEVHNQLRLVQCFEGLIRLHHRWRDEKWDRGRPRGSSLALLNHVACHLYQKAARLLRFGCAK